MAFLVAFEKIDWTVIVEDDDNVAYAYLLRGRKIVADVWLYNRSSTPRVPPWRTGAKMPFRNSAEYVAGLGVMDDVTPEAVTVSWKQDESDAGPCVTVCIHQQPVAWLVPSAKPGWSALVKQSGPLARMQQDCPIDHQRSDS